MTGKPHQVNKAGLYIVATPIGNLGDMSLRGIETLQAVDVVLCEDSRVSGKLMKHYGIETTLEAYHDHSDEALRASIVARIQDGLTFALISDAGMPLVSDPGYKLVRDLRGADLFVTSIPGANAPLAALQLSGLPSDAFSFVGFLPSKTKARRDVLARWKSVPGTLIAFESVGRLLGSLADICDVLGDVRRVAVVREITKAFEETRLDYPSVLIAHYETEGLPKGECVIVIEPPVVEDFSEEQIDVMLRDALEDYSTKEAAAIVAEQTGLSKKVLYNKALGLKQ